MGRKLGVYPSVAIYDGRRIILKNTDRSLAVLIVFIGLISSHNYKIAVEIELR